MSAARAETSLSVEDLVFSIRDLVRVGPVGFTLEAGSSLGIVGETGSGKSLLCRTLVGMLGLTGGQIDSGSVRFRGVEYARADRAAWAELRRSTVGYMPQASMSGLNPVRRVGSQLLELLHGGRAERTARALELLEQVQMRDPARVMRSYPHELSGGMRQRVMLAFALTGDPAVLVADEPTTALDATVQAEVLALISRIQRERRMSLVLVSHDMRVIRRMCDEVVVMYRGRVLEQGPVERVLSRPEHPYTAALLAADPALAERKTMLGTIDEAALRHDLEGADRA